MTCVAHILSQRIKMFFLVTPGIVRGSFSSLPQQMGSSALKNASIVLTSSVESRSEKPSQTDGCKFFPICHNWWGFCGDKLCFSQCLRGIRCFEPEWTGSVIKSEEGVCKAENGVKPRTGAVKCKRTEATSQKIHQTLGRRRTASCSERLLCHSSETHHSCFRFSGYWMKTGQQHLRRGALPNLA